MFKKIKAHEFSPQNYTLLWNDFHTLKSEYIWMVDRFEELVSKLNEQGIHTIEKGFFTREELDGRNSNE